MALNTYIITPEQLKNAMQEASTDTHIIPVCASWFLPNDLQGRNGAQVFAESRIPSARFLDIDVVKGDSPYPHMLPTAPDFASAMDRLGIAPSDTVVVYDSKELGIFSAPRVAWMLRIFGHQRVHVLNNYRRWINEGHPTESGPAPLPSAITPVEYPVPPFPDESVADFETMKQIASDRCIAAQVLDARPHGRWTGAEPEPRPGLPSGHMPGSISVPFNEILDPKDKTILPPKALQELFSRKGVESGRPIISSCGTGVTAAVVDLALREAFGGNTQRKIYDGSWTEWAQRATAEEGLIEKS